MEIVKCFLIHNNIEDCDNLLEKFPFKDEKLGIEITTYICIGSEEYYKHRSDITYSSSREQEEKLNKKIIKHNKNEIIKLASESEDNINFSDIRGKIIDDFNTRKLFIYMYTDIRETFYKKYYNNNTDNNDNIYEIMEYNNVEEIDYFIFNINNELFKLGKTIRLYKSNSEYFMKNTSNLEPIILGQKEISIELQKEHENFNHSIKLKDLIDKLIKSMHVKNSLQRHYKIDDHNLFKCHRSKCYSREYNELCKLCITNEIIVEYKICEKILNRILYG